MVQLVGSSSLGLGKLIDGKNQFVHIRYSANANGSNMTIEIQADTKYIGIATSSSETAPTSPSDYSWGRFVGTPGASSYTWIRYSSNEDGSNMTTIPNEETKYIGVAITAEDSAPTDHTEYSWALFKGEDGRGVKKTEVSYQKSTSGTVIPTGSWSASIPSVSDGEYLWTRTLFTYTDGTTTSTYNVSRNGMAGLGIARADVHYQKSTSGTTVPLGTWTVTIPAVEANEYLWTRTTITYTNYLTSVSYSVGKMGADGKDAQLLYLTATSEILAFDSDDKPKTTQPITISAKLQNASGTATFVAIPYIGNTAQTPITLGGTGNDRTLLPSQWTDPKWTIVAITATLGSLTDTVSIHKLKDGQNGVDGVDGADGLPGVGVESATITYAASTSGTVHPTDGWSEAIPSVPSGQYLWTRTVWLYTNGMSETSYSVSMMGERGPQGPQGDQGNDGVAGKDGVGVRSTVITYGLSSSDTTQPTSWGAQVPALTKGKYLWTKTVWSYTDNTSETSYQKTYIARDGNDGTDGLPGKDGVGISSTTITYAVSTSGTTKPVGGWSTTVPAVPSGQYLWTRTVWSYTDSTSETSYSVAKMGERGPQGPQGIQGIQGPKGDQGIAGRPGADGRTSYTHIAYANSADGTLDFSVSDSNRIYIGVYVDFNATDSTSPGSYQWSLIKGADGADGAPGKPGADGRTPYFHTAYANSADGSSGFSTTDSNGKLYLGTCTDYTQADPTDYRAYTWVKIKGEQGPQGIQGPSGANGQSLYTWLKYADDANGNGMSETPDGKKYIGLAYNRPIPTESNNPKDYTWSLIQGQNGVNGIDGKTYYTWVKYADTSTGGGLSDNPTGKKYIGLAYNKATPTESSNPGDYQWALIKGDKGDKGDRGDDGLPGKDGVGLKSTVITYGLSSSETTQPSSWAAQVPTLTKGKYLWTKTVWTYTDNTTETSYQKTYIARDGNNGADGLPGKDGVGIANTTVQYAQSTSGTTKPTSGWSTIIPAVASGNYLWTKTTWTYTDDTSESGYSVAKMGERGPQGLQGIQGPKGDQGVKGATGADGKSSYTHIAYANSADGRTDFSVSDSNRKYIGMYVDFNATDSTNPSSYQWSLIKGADGRDGADGLPGKPGTDGRTPYFHTAYANSADGSSGFSTTDASGKLYMGTCTDYTQSDPTDYRAYTWVKIKGDKGDQGIQGPKGDNGQSLYTWLKYADDINGNGMSETPNGKKYIGLAYNKTTATESTNPGDYTWSLIQGANGVNGADGKTYYTWVKYADSATGSGISDNPSGKSYIGLAYNKTTPTESTNPGDYQWALIKGDRGPAGQDGKGVKSYAITYQAGTSGTTAPTGTWTTTIPTVPQGRYLWTKMVITYTDNTSSTSYSVSYIPVNGQNGATGATGNGVSSIITEFYLSTSKTTQTGGSWSTTQPTWSPGKYVWTRNKITYTNGSTAYTTPQCSSEWEAVNNIQIGGTNLIKNTSNKLQHLKRSDWLALAASDNTKNFNLADYLGKRLTLRVWIQKPSVDAKLQLYFNAPGWKAGSIVKAGQSGYSQLTVDVPTTLPTYWNLVLGTSNGVGFSLDYKELKAEIGDFATSWSPAPEDTQDQIDNIHVGGRNLYVQSANNTFAGDISAGSDTSRVLDTYGFKSVYNASKAGLSNVRLQQLQFNGIKYATVSFDAYVNTGSLDLVVDICDGTAKGYNISTTKTRYSLFVDNINKYNTPDGYNGFVDFMFTLKEGQTFYVENVMVEHATKPSNHSPAPEDTQHQIDQANENISNKVDQGAYDQDKSVIYDDINKKLDDEEFREFQKIMNELKGSYDSFVGEGGRYEQELKNALAREQAIVQDFGDKVKQLNFINTYIRESEEGLIIGAKNSPMQMLLSKDSLSFMDGGQTVAYFSNQSFYINRGAVVESLQVGVHKLTKIGNEHTVIQYIPQ